MYYYLLLIFLFFFFFTCLPVATVNAAFVPRVVGVVGLLLRAVVQLMSGKRYAVATPRHGDRSAIACLAAVLRPVCGPSVKPRPATPKRRQPRESRAVAERYC